MFLSISFFILDSIIWVAPLFQNFYSEDQTCAKTDLSPQNAFRWISPKPLLTREWDNKPRVQRWLFIGHHLVCLASFFTVLSSDTLAYFVTYRLMAELSTPFLNLVFISEQLPHLPPWCHHVAVVSFSLGS